MVLRQSSTNTEEYQLTYCFVMCTVLWHCNHRLLVP